MASFEVWDVIKVPFPYTNRPVEQYRPALVIARHKDASSPELFWVLMITSAGHRRWAGDVETTDLSACGLPAASMVRTAKIATVESAGATLIGHLPVAERAAVQTEVAKMLGPMQ